MTSSPACARKLIEASVDYAGGLGFAPAVDYEEASVVFGDIDPGDCADTFTFGRDGKPFYVSGPYDSEEKRGRILAMLEARCGEGNYNYSVIVGDNPSPDSFEFLDED